MSIYQEPANTLLLAGRLAATKATAEDLVGDPRIDAIYEAAQHAALGRLGAGPLAISEWSDRRVVAAAILATHAVHLVVREQSDEDLADLVLGAVRAIRRDLSERLGRARDVETAARMVRADAVVSSEVGGALDDIASLLRRNGSEYVAAAGHLVRRVGKNPRPYQEHLGTAWYAVCGRFLLLPRDVARAAAVALVTAKAEKSEVARLGGISRTTLNEWLAAARLPNGEELD